MDEHQFNERLSQLSTCWTLLAQAHGGGTDLEAVAQNALIQRYQGAIYRYLLGALRDPDAADEVFQEFALRFVRGDFRHADAGRGRFRFYVKTALSNLILAYRRRRARQGGPGLAAPEDVAARPDEPAGDDAQFLDGWRKALLDRAWEALAARRRPDGPPFYEALRLRTDNPDLSAAQLTDRLNAAQPGRAVTEVGLRKVLQRARELFTDLLVAEVARSLRGGALDQVEEELIDLGFQTYCKKALERRRAGGAADTDNA